MAKASKNGKHRETVLEVPVQFAGISIGPEVARLGTTISRDECELEEADRIFCGRRIEVDVVLGKRTDAKGQTKMWESDRTISGVADVKGIGVGPDTYRIGLSFGKHDVDLAELSEFAKGAGKLVVYGVAEIPEKAKGKKPKVVNEDGDEEESDEDDSDLEEESDEADSSLVANKEVSWKLHPVAKVYSGGILAGLQEGLIHNMGGLVAYIARGEELTTLKGIGAGKAANIRERLEEFARANGLTLAKLGIDQPVGAGA